MGLYIKEIICRFQNTDYSYSREFSPSASRKRRYNFDPLKPHFYIVKLGFTEIYIIFLILLKTDCGYSLEPHRRCCSNEYPKSLFWAEIGKNIRIFYLKIFIFLVVKFSVFLNRHFFVMWEQILYFKSCPYFGSDSRGICSRFFLGVCKNNSVLAMPL